MKKPAATIHEPEARLTSRKAGSSPVLTGVDIRGTLNGAILDMYVEQRYRNDGAVNIEAVYTFPLAHDAVLLGLTVELNGKTLEGVAVAKRQAEMDYEEAIADGNSAIMLERSGQGLYTTNLGNLMPGESAVIRFRYAQALRYVQGNLRLLVPTVVAPRYGDPVKQGGLPPGVVPQVNALVSYPLSFELEIMPPLSACPVHSPSHTLARRELDGGGVVLALSGSGSLDRDIVVNISQVPMDSTAMLAHDGDRVVAMASFCPPSSPRADRVRSPLHLKLLVDCSGSMCGDSIAAARRALHRILAALEPGDRVTYSRFGSSICHDTSEPVVVDPDDRSLQRLAQHIAATDAGLGGTEMRMALESTFRLRNGEEPVLLLITDGETWDIAELVKTAGTSRHRVFAVGIGSSPAEGLLHKLAQATGGACDFVAPNEDVEGAVLRLFSRIRAPRIRNVKIRWPGSPEMASDAPDTLFENETLHLFACWNRAPEGSVTITWQLDDNPAPQSAQIRLPAMVGARDVVPRLYGARRVEAAEQQEDAELATELAVKYQLVSQETNYLVVHQRSDAERATTLPELSVVDQMLAAGWGGTGSVRGKDAIQARIARSREPSSDLLAFSIPASRGSEPRYSYSRPHIRSQRTVRTNAGTPEELLDLLMGEVEDHEFLPQDVASLAKLIPDDIARNLHALEKRHGADAVIYAFYMALLLLVRAGIGDRRMRQPLREALMELQGRAPQEVAAAPVFPMTSADWGIVSP
jgi:Ca-activated chloride channel family protein